MKKTMLAALLALCMVLSLGAGALADGAASSNPYAEMPIDELIAALNSNELTDEEWSAAVEQLIRLSYCYDLPPEDFMAVAAALEELSDPDKLTEAQSIAMDEAFQKVEAEIAGGSDDAEEGGDVIAYHLTEDDMRTLADALGGFDREDVFHAFDHIRLTMDLFPTTYADAVADILDGGNGAAEKVSADTYGFLGTESQLEVVAAVSDWIEQQQIEQDRVDDFFWSLFDVDDISETFDAIDKILSGELLPTEGPAKTAEDAVTDQDLQALLTCIGKAVKDEYLTPNGIDPAALVWPTDPATFRYFNEMFTNYCISALTGEPPAPVRDDYVPASPDKEIMDAVYAGIMSWLDGFASVDYEYLISLSQEISTFEYIMEYLPANLTFA